QVTVETVRIVATLGLDQAVARRMLLEAGNELLHTAIAEQRILTCHNLLRQRADDDSTLATDATQPDYAMSLLFVPLRSRSRDLLGVIVAGLEAVDEFPARVEADISRIAPLAAVAIETAYQRDQTRATEQHWSELIHGLDAIIWEADAETGNYTFVNDTAVEMLGYSVERWVSEPGFWKMLVHPDDREWVFATCADIKARQSEGQLEYRIVAADGHTVWVRDVYYVIAASNERPASMRGLLIDITDRKLTEAALIESEERFRSAFDDAPISMTIIDARTERIDRVNPPFCAMLGYTQRELVGANLRDITFAEDLGLKRHVIADLLSGAQRTITFEASCRRKDGTATWGLISASIVHDHDGEPLHILAQVQDISDRRDLEARLVHQAFHDALTGLPNRALLLDRLQQALASSQRTGLPVALLFCDLDNFKIINDSLGHAVGDDLLVQVARRVETVLRRNETVARFGGDELAVLLPSVVSLTSAIEVAQRLLDAFAEPFMVQSRETFVTASIGIALNRHGGNDPDDLLRWADIAMYRAKAAGRNRFDVYDPRVHASATERLDLEHDLRQAIEQDQLVLHYQPKIALIDGSIGTIEALVRWQHPTRGLVPPADFIPLAEETGLIVPLGEWVLREACRQARSWADQLGGTVTPGVCVNVSAVQLRHSDLVERIDESLAESGLDPSHLVIEITESVMMHDVELTTRTLQRLTDAGVRLAIDDFGMAYSSLSRLNRFPLNELKIDRHFVASLGVDLQGTIIVSGMIGLGHALGMNVVGEGVETSEQLRRLCELGCDSAQGFYFARPQPAGDIARLLSVGGAVTIRDRWLVSTRSPAAIKSND
ncbi:MAG TPA: EAL domain-containing protein, partial [Thermomicrobiales bacterium]|nr:EAL domain-containing protein [Thermomicrobiales bacterium]